MSDVRRNLDALLGAAVPTNDLDQRAANAGSSEVFYGNILDGSLIIDGSDTPLPGPFESLVPYGEGNRVAFVLRGRRPLIIQVQGGFAASDDFAGLTSMGEDNAENIAELDAVQQLLDQKADRLADAMEAFEEWQPSVDSGLQTALNNANQAAQDATQAKQDATDAYNAAMASVSGTQIEYALSSSRVTAPTSGWTTSTVTPSASQVVWTRTKVTYADNSSTYTSPIVLTGPEGPEGEEGPRGPAGADGAGIEIAGSVATYANLPSNLTVGDAGEAYLVEADGLLYIWDGTNWPANGNGVAFQGPEGPRGPAGAKGDDGSDGSDGVSVVSVVPYYRLAVSQPLQPSGASPADWSTSEPAPDFSKSLWRADRVELSNSTYTWTPVVKVSAYTAAGLAMTAADGKNKITYGSTQPADPKTGDRWYNSSNGTAWIWSGTAWRSTEPGDGFVPALDIGSGTAGDLEVGRLKAQTSSFSTAVINNLTAQNAFMTNLLAEQVVVSGDPTNKVGAILLENGAVTAPKLESELVLASEIIAGDTEGYHTVMDQTGIHFNSLIYDADEDTSSVAEVLRINTPGVDSEGTVFGLANPKDLESLVASIDVAGAISGSDVTVENTVYANELVLGGETVSELLWQFPRGVVAWGQGDPTAGTFSTTQRFAEVEFTASPGRLYKITAAGPDVTASTADFPNMVLEVDGTTQVRSFMSMAAVKQVLIGQYDAGTDETDKQVTVALKGVPNTKTFIVHSNSSSRRTTIFVEDVGPSIEQSAEFLTSASAPAPTKKEVTKTWDHSWIKSFPINSFYNGKAVQGTYGGNTYQGFIGFPSVTSILSGAEIVEIKVYVYFSHWYYNAGGTASIKVHGATSSPGSAPAVSGAAQSLTTNKPGGAWLKLPSSWHAGFKSGAIRGIALVGTGLAAYGYATSAKLRITYKK